MRVVIQRVSSASVTIGGAVKSSIGAGLLVLLLFYYRPLSLFIASFEKKKSSEEQG